MNFPSVFEWSAVDWYPVHLSLGVALVATAIAVLLGVSAGWLLARKHFPGKELLDALLALPLVLPPTVLGYYLLVLLSTRSPLGQVFESVFGFRLIFTVPAAVLAAVLHGLPFMVKMVRGAMEDLDPASETAARTLGASEARVFFTSTLPLVRRSVLAATLLAFARALGDFGVTIMIAGNIPGRTQTAAVAIYDAVQAGRENYALLLSVIISDLCVTILYSANRLTASASRW